AAARCSESTLPGLVGTWSPVIVAPRLAVIGAVLPTSVGGELLDGVPGDDLVEHGLLVARLAEDAAQPLDVLADRARPREHHGDVRLGDVHPLVEHSRGGDDPIGAPLELQQDILA